MINDLRTISPSATVTNRRGRFALLLTTTLASDPSYSGIGVVDQSHSLPVFAGDLPVVATRSGLAVVLPVAQQMLPSYLHLCPGHKTEDSINGSECKEDWTVARTS